MGVSSTLTTTTTAQSSCSLAGPPTLDIHPRSDGCQGDWGLLLTLELGRQFILLVLPHSVGIKV